MVFELFKALSILHFSSLLSRFFAYEELFQAKYISVDTKLAVVNIGSKFGFIVAEYSLSKKLLHEGADLIRVVYFKFSCVFFS